MGKALTPIKRHSFRFKELGVSLAALLALGVTPSVAAPLSGSFENGMGEIIRDGLTTTVVQNSARAVVGWQSFDLAANETVEFIQPDVSSAILKSHLGQQPESHCWYGSRQWFGLFCQSQWDGFRGFVAGYGQWICCHYGGSQQF